jgi:ABC-type glycerol-3-phosphate transport system substrate-binding protein
MKLRPFELALVVIFSSLALIALFILNTYDPKPKGGKDEIAIGSVRIWGTIPADGINRILTEISKSDKNYNQVSYRYISPETFDTVLVNALADREGPDIILISQEMLVEMRKRIQPVSYESFPVRDMRNLYVDGAQIFALSDGLYGYPIAVDPLMMYWNRDILATEGYLHPPATWEELVNTLFPSLIKRDFDRSIQRSVVAMGEYGNVRNAFGVISALFIQGGSDRVLENDRGQYVVRLQTSPGGQDPLRAATDFYTRFSRPSNALYSWNRAFKGDREQFISEDLAFYFGYGSEGPAIERLNPNLNFDIAEIPQGETATTRRTYGRFYAVSALRGSNNLRGASAVMFRLATAETAQNIALASNMTPVHRHLISAGSNDTYGRITYRSTSVALGWLNPELAVTNQIFQSMTSDINENRRDLSGAVSDAVRRLNLEY